jgi:GntR family transcriptional regulator
MTVTRSSAVPLYAQIKDTLKHEIHTRMKAGESFPAEPELERRFGVSRITVRRALDELVAAGLIVREQGRGTFVREHRITQELTRLMSWTVAMREIGVEPRTLSCEIDVIRPPAEIAGLLRARGNVVRIRRVRAVDDEPVALMTNYLLPRLVPGLVKKGLMDGSLYATLAAHGIVPASALDRVEARPVTAIEARLLKIDKRAIVLQVTRTTYDLTTRPLYVAVVVNPGDNYSYTVRVDGRGFGTPNI